MQDRPGPLPHTLTGGPASRWSARVGDPDLERGTRLARAVTGASAAVVNYIGDGQALVLASADLPTLPPGATTDMRDVPCRFVVATGLPEAVTDLRTDPRTSTDPFTLTSGAVAYLGVPLRCDDGEPVGTLCVTDTRPRAWTAEQTAALMDLAQLLGSRLALGQERHRAAELVQLHTDMIAGSLSGLVVMDEHGVVLATNPALTQMLGWQEADLLGRTVGDTLVPQGLRAAHAAGVDRVRDGSPPTVLGQVLQVNALAKDGEEVPVELAITRSDSDAGTRYAGSLRDLRPQQRLQAGVDSLLHSAPVALLEVDLAGVVRRAQGLGVLGAADLVGHALSDVLGETVSTRLTGPDHDGSARLDLDALGRAWRAAAIPMRTAGGPPTGWVVSLVDISDVRSAQTQLEEAARRDPLTGLLNRVGLEGAVHDMVAGTPDRALSVTTLRMHGLGETNESFGHEVGDELLRIMAGRLRRILPADQDPVVARVDAGQFSVVTWTDRGLGAGWAAAAARLLTRAVRVRALSVVPRISVGTASCHPGEADDLGADDRGVAVVEELLRRAEVAVHAARRAGQPQRAYQRSDDVASRRMVLASNLREALSTPPDGANDLHLGGRLFLAYQPVVALGGGGVSSVEALLRWQDPVLGLLSPVEVVDVAESSGLAVALGEHVMALALRDAAGWWRSGTHAPVMVNMSALQVCDPSVVGSVTSLLERQQLPGQALVVEVTETATLTDAPAAARALEQVRLLGARVYLDDFGTGWSTLERIAELPLDGIKLDRSFAARSHEPTGIAAIHAAVALARTLGVPLVVEGVETTVQARTVAAAGADRGQGYLWSRPVPVGRLREEVFPELARAVVAGALRSALPRTRAPGPTAPPAAR